MKLLHYNKSGVERDLTSLVQKYVWSGDYREAARRLEVSVTTSATDTNLPTVTVDTADMLVLFGDDGNELFRGYVFKKTKSVTGNELSLTVYDGLIYLIKSKFSKVFLGVTAEQVAAATCSELGVPAGDFAKTGIPQSFPHLAKSGYEAIMTAYTTAGKQNGKVYMPRMSAGKLNVIEKGTVVAKRLVLQTEHITDSTYTEDIENMVNAVQITDENGNRLGTIRNEDWVQAYGLLQDVYQREQGKDAVTMARAMLKDLNRESIVELIGGPDTYDMIAGNAVQIKESFTGLTGLFYIDADTHTFQNGQHTISLTLNFQNVMDEQQADSFKSSGSSNISLTLDEY
jgi:uncharacterized protein YrzB (UPF0473 family)